ncbi:MAG: hypothetical protein ACXVEE_43505 [Polyangiales bacterium]
MAFIARWSFEVPFGKKEDAFRILDQWEQRSRSMGWPPHRALVGSIGVSEAVVESEYQFETLGDLDEAWSKLSDPKFHAWQEEIAPFVVPGSHKWTIYRVHEVSAARGKRPKGGLVAKGRKAIATKPVMRGRMAARRLGTGPARS